MAIKINAARKSGIRTFDHSAPKESTPEDVQVIQVKPFNKNQMVG